jgi:hypothetical protein
LAAILKTGRHFELTELVFFAESASELQSALNAVSLYRKTLL